jgi:membrane associated rhomboid family serine protease
MIPLKDDLPSDLQWLPRFASPLTSMFLHGGWMHLLRNRAL